MKKIIPIILIAISVVHITGCNSQPTVAANKDQNKSEEVVPAAIEHLTPETFKSKVFDYSSTEYMFVGDKPCIIDFYASWCGPCRTMAPTLQTVAEEYKGKIVVYKVDADAHGDLAAAFGVSGIPSLLFCPKNSKPQMSSGLLSKADLDKAIAEVLLK